MLTRCIGFFISAGQTPDVLTVLPPKNLNVTEIQIFAIDTDILYIALNESDLDGVQAPITVYPGLGGTTNSANTVFKLRAARWDAPIITPLYIQAKGTPVSNNGYIVFTGWSDE
jgi:hypothetical protein